MKPVTIKQNDQSLMFDKVKKHAEIKITQDCKIKEQIFDYYLSQISSVESLKIHISDTNISDKLQYTFFIQLRDALLVKVSSDLKNLNKIYLTYNIQNLGQMAIKKVVTFLQTVSNAAKVIEECNISITYSQPLMHFDSILETINKYYLCISGSITSFSLRLHNDLYKESLLSLSELFLKLKNVQKFIFYCSTSLNLKTDDNLNQFIQSMKNIVKSAHHFEFDLSEGSYQRGVISSITEQLSLLISQGGEELSTVILNFEKVGWTFDRQKLLKGNFIYGLAQMMHKWPSSIRNLQVNLDRALSYNENMIGDNIKQLLDGFHNIIPQLESFELNLNGIGFSMNDFQTTFADSLTSLFNNAKKLTSLDLKLSGHLSLTFNQWTKLFSNITSIPLLKNLTLDIERWKNFLNDLEVDVQITLINKFLDDLYKNQNNTLKKFHFNMDDWKYLTANTAEYIQKLMRFNYVDDFQLLWYKTQHLDTLKNVDLIQTMSNYIQRETYKLILLKKMGISLNDQAVQDFQDMEEEQLDKHIKYFLYLNRKISKQSPTFQNITDMEE